MSTLIKHNKPIKGNEIIVPYLAIHNNVDFMLNGGVGDVELKDGTLCKSVECVQLKFEESEDEIKRIYNISKNKWRSEWLKRVSDISDYIVKIKLDTDYDIKKS